MRNMVVLGLLVAVVAGPCVLAGCGGGGGGGSGGGCSWGSWAGGSGSCSVGGISIALPAGFEYDPYDITVDNRSGFELLGLEFRETSEDRERGQPPNLWASRHFEPELAPGETRWVNAIPDEGFVRIRCRRADGLVGRSEPIPMSELPPHGGVFEVGHALLAGGVFAAVTLAGDVADIPPGVKARLDVELTYDLGPLAVQRDGSFGELELAIEFYGNGIPVGAVAPTYIRLDRASGTISLELTESEWISRAMLVRVRAALTRYEAGGGDELRAQYWTWSNHLTICTACTR